MRRRPPTSRRPSRPPVAVVATLLVVSGLAAGCGSGAAGAASAPTPPSQGVGTRLDAPVAREVLSLPLRDSAGHVRRLADFRGRVLVVSDAMTLCQEACPVDTAGVVQLARDVDKAGLQDKVEFLTVTIDPARDTPARLGAYRRLFAPVPQNWLTLTGSAVDIARLWKSFGVYMHRVPEGKPAATDWLTGKPLTYDVDHSDEVFFLSGQGHERFVLEGLPHVDHGTSVPRRLYRFMDAQGHQNVNDPQDAGWTVPQGLQVLGWLLGRPVGSSARG